MRHTIVTGAGGFIGRALVRTLIETGKCVCALVPTLEEAAGLSAELGERIDVRIGPIDTREDVEQALSGVKPGVVFHLAGRRTKGGVEALSRNVDDNLRPTIALVEALCDRDIEAFVLASSGEVYGRGKAPFAETAPTLPTTGYALSKRLAEEVVLAAHRSKKLPAIVARLAVVYGPGQLGAAMLIPLVIQSARRGVPLRMTPGDQTRDFVYVADVIDCLIAVAEVDAARGDVVNIGSGEARAVADVAALVLRAMGNPVHLERGALPYGADEIMEYVFDVSRLLALIGKRPSTPLEEGIRRTLESA